MSSENQGRDETQAGKGLRVGLCANCHHMRKIESDRGSTFYLCERSATDPLFPKYPRLPVLACSGYERCNRTEVPHEQP